MKIGFSSLACPDWDLDKITARASEFGFDGVELRGLKGELHLPVVSELADDPKRTRALFADRNLELVCLGSSATLDARSRSRLAAQTAIIAEYIELARRLECPNIRIMAGEVQRHDDQRLALARIATALRSLVEPLTRAGVTLLVENGGDFPSSQDLWFIVDAASHPCIRCCWNQCHAMIHGERATVSLPRLARKIGMLHVCDAAYDESGVLLEYKPLGQGEVEVARSIDLLRGLLYDGYLIFEWPKLWVEQLAEPESVLPEVARFLRERIAAVEPCLSAYKGDKRPVRLVRRDASAATTG